MSAIAGAAREAWGDVPRSPGTPEEPGNAYEHERSPFLTPTLRNEEHGGTPLYADIGALLDGTLPDAPEPEVLACNDGTSLFYAGQVNLLFGDPESGKTWVALAAAAEVLRTGGQAAVVDLDHNGPAATVARLLDLGAHEEALRTPSRFRYTEPEDGHHALAVVADLAHWRPRVVVVDSLGEVLPLFGASSNSPDDFTRVHTLVLKPLAMSGAAVVVIDHLAKGSESRAMGSTGTAAKKRAVGGVSLRVTVADQFTPGHGGAAHITIAKDRHGGLRAHRPTGDREPLAATFRLYPPEHHKRFDVIAPEGGQRNPLEAASREDLARLAALDPPPRSVRDVKERLRISSERATSALREWRRNQRSPFLTPGVGNEEHGPEAGGSW